MIGTGIVAIFIFLFFYNHKRPERIVILQIMYSIFVGFAIYNLGAPRIALYFSDVINVFLCMYLFGTPGGRRRLSIFRGKCKYTYIAMATFFAVGTMSAIINYSGTKSILLYFWSLRNYFRFFIFLILCVCYVRMSSLPKLFTQFRWILYLSTFLSIYQYFVMGYGKLGHSGDLIGGIFGTVTLGNASICLFASGLCVYYICAYVRKEVSLVQTACIVLCSVTSAVLGEIKFFFFVLILIGAILLITNRPNIKTIIIVILGAIVLTYALSAIQVYYSGSGTRSLNSIDGIVEYITKSSYSYTTDSINRIGGIATIKRIFFGNKESLFGVGLGMADHSSFFSSTIYEQYGHINYSWFMIPYLYLETGWVGVIAFILIFVGILVDYLRIGKTKSAAKNIGIILSAVALIMIVYNCSLRVDTAYVYYGFLAFPFLDSEDGSFVFFYKNPRTRIRQRQ